MSTRLTSILFADDTRCFIEGTDLSDMCIQLSTEMNKLSTWFKTNRLSLNVSKTNCMIFGRSNQPDHNRVYIDNIVIERVNCNKFLGVIIDSKLQCNDIFVFVYDISLPKLCVSSNVIGLNIFPETNEARQRIQAL